MDMLIFKYKAEVLWGYKITAYYCKKFLTAIQTGGITNEKN